MKTIIQEWESLTTTFKRIGKESALVVLIELAYFSLLYFFANPMPAFELIAAKEMDTFIFDQTQLLINENILNQNISLMTSFFIKLGIVFIGFVLFHALLYSIFNYFSWANIADKHYNLEHAKGFVWISFLWTSLWGIGFGALLFLIKEEAWGYALIATTLLFMHMTTLLNIALIHKKGKHTFFGVVKRTLKLTIHKLPHALPPVTSGIFILVLGSALLVNIADVVPFIATILPHLLFAYFVTFITWFRMHLYYSLKEHALG